MNDLAEEILLLLAKRGRLGIEEIQARFSLTKDTTSQVIDFLAEFGFVEFNGSNHHVVLSEPCRRFFTEQND